MYKKCEALTYAQIGINKYMWENAIELAARC